MKSESQDIHVEIKKEKEKRTHKIAVKNKHKGSRWAAETEINTIQEIKLSVTTADSHNAFKKQSETEPVLPSQSRAGWSLFSSVRCTGGQALRDCR